MWSYKNNIWHIRKYYKNAILKRPNILKTSKLKNSYSKCSILFKIYKN